MSNETRDMLHENMMSIKERLSDIMAAIEGDLPYFEGEPELPDGAAGWSDGGYLIDAEGNDFKDEDGYYVELIDLPDALDPHDYLADYPLEVVDERGREFAVVLGTGGPHIEIAADGLAGARLEGYWGGERVTLYGDVFDKVLDWFIDRALMTYL